MKKLRTSWETDWGTWLLGVQVINLETSLSVFIYLGPFCLALQW